MSYNAPLHLYLLVSSHGTGNGELLNGSLGVFAARAPWGPWRTLYYSNNWSPGISYEQKFPPHYMSAGGRQMWCLFSGNEGTPYKFALRRAVLARCNQGPHPCATPQPAQGSPLAAGTASAGAAPPLLPPAGPAS